MHELEGGDYVTVSGHHAFKDTDPATELIATDANMLLFEIMNSVLRSGQTLAASGAADQTAGWKQLANAIAQINDDRTPKSLTTALLSGGGSTQTFTLQYIIHGLGKLTTLLFPRVVLTLASPSAVIAITDGTSALPNYLVPRGTYDQWKMPIIVCAGGFSGIPGYLGVTDFGGGAPMLQLIKSDGTNFSGSFNGVEGGCITFVNNA